MKKEHSITQLIIDESGSMNSAKNYVLDTYQSIVKAMLNERIEYPELQQYIDVWTFSNDTDQVKQVMPFQQIAWDIDDIPTLSYQPNGGTPLYDAMGKALISLETVIAQHHGFNDPDISIMILTDGMENASSLFTGDQISNMVQRFQQQKWKFQYFGTDHDVHAMAQRISILRARSFGKNSAGFQEVSDSYVVERRNEKEAFLRAKGLWRDK